MNKYYVYCHKFKDTDEIFYIGKGCGKRLYSKHRSNRWKELTKENDYIAEILYDNLGEDEALDIEHKLILELNPIGNSNNKKSKIKSINFVTISKIVEYDETSPTFLRYISHRANNAYKPGDVAGSYDSEGYGQIYIIDKLYKIHRVVYCLFSGVDLDSKYVIDHIDRNKSNNKIDNLRLVSISENMKNVNWKVSKPTNTGERAISERINFKSFRVSWSENGKQKEKTFSYSDRSDSTRELALEAAIAFRNSLVDEDLLII